MGKHRLHAGLGITKLMLSEAGNSFPELTLFYQREVISPASN